MPTIQFTIPGRLPGKKRAGRRFTGDRVVQTYNPVQTQSAEAMVQWYAAQAMKERDIAQIAGAVSLHVRVFRNHPKTWSKKRKAKRLYVTGKPDADNICKLIADALNGVAYRDDVQIAELSLVRLYTRNPEATEITVQELEAA
jgi:Holliday junction resolvase RusA-like endonuclease